MCFIMNRIAPVLVALFTVSALATSPAATPTVVASPPEPAVTACYITVSQRTLEEDKACAVYKAPDCSKNHRSCKMSGNFCKGLIASFCEGMAPRSCWPRVELVTAIPKQPVKGAEKYHCIETNPIRLNKL